MVAVGRLLLDAVFESESMKTALSMALTLARLEWSQWNQILLPYLLDMFKSSTASISSVITSRGQILFPSASGKKAKKTASTSWLLEPIEWSDLLDHQITIPSGEATMFSGFDDSEDDNTSMASKSSSSGDSKNSVVSELSIKSAILSVLTNISIDASVLVDGLDSFCTQLSTTQLAKDSEYLQHTSANAKQRYDIGPADGGIWGDEASEALGLHTLHPLITLLGPFCRPTTQTRPWIDGVYQIADALKFELEAVMRSVESNLVSTLQLLSLFDQLPLEESDEDSFSKRHGKKQPAEQCPAIQLAIELESTETSLAMYKEKLNHLRRLTVLASNGRIPDVYQNLSIIKQMGLLAGAKSDLFWSARLLIETGLTPDAKKWLANQQAALPKLDGHAMECPNLTRFDRVENLEEGSALYSRLHSPDQLFKMLADPHSKPLVQTFLVFVQDDYGWTSSFFDRHQDKRFNIDLAGRSKRASEELCALWLKLLAKFRRPRSLFASEALYSLYLRLLTKGDNATQLLAIECILTWQDSEINTYAENLRNLLDERKFRDELTVFDMSATGESINAVHRAKLMPTLDGMKSAESQFSVRCCASLLESASIHSLLLSETPESDNAMDGHRVAMAAQMIKQLGFKATPIFHEALVAQKQLDAANLELQAYLAAKGDAVDAAVADADDPADNDDDDEDDNNAAGDERGRIESKRRPGPDDSSTPDFDFEPYMPCICEVVVNPRLDLLSVENTQNPSALLLLFRSWTLTPKYLPYLTGYNPRTFSMLVSILVAPKVQAPVVNLILDILQTYLDYSPEQAEKAFRLTPEQAEACGVIAKQTIQDHVSQILSHMKVCFAGVFSEAAAQGQTGKSSNILLRQIHLLSRVADYTTQQTADAKVLLDLLLPMLKRPNGAVNERTKADVLAIMLRFVPIVLDQNDDTFTDDERLALFNTYVDTVSVGLSRLRLPTARSLMCEILSVLAKIDLERGHPQLEVAAGIVQDVNAFSEHRIDEPDFDRRLAAYAKLNDEIWDKPDQLGARAWVPILHNLVFFAQDHDEMSIRSNASYGLLRFIARVKQANTSEEAEGSDEVRLINRNVVSIVLPTTIVRNEFLVILRTAVREIGQYFDQLRDLQVLDNPDEEANFYYNIMHIQIHRRMRAMRRFRALVTANANEDVEMAEPLDAAESDAEGESDDDNSDVSEEEKPAAEPTTIKPFNFDPPSSPISMANLRNLFMPLFEHWVMSTDRSVSADLAHEAVQTIGALGAVMPWSMYNSTLRKYLSVIKKTPNLEKRLLRLVLALLDNFHFDLRNVQVDAFGHVLGRSADQPLDEDNEDDVENAAKELQAERIHESLVRSLIPELKRKIGSSDEDAMVLRAPVAMAVIRLLTILPEQTKNLQLPGVLTNICNMLRAKSLSARSATRDTLMRIAKFLGAGYFGFIVKELSSALARGFHKHILSYTIYILLKEMAFSNVRLMLAPLRDILQETDTPKRTKLVDRLLHQISVGLNRNRTYETKTVLLFSHSIIKQYLALSTKTAKDTEANREQMEQQKRMKPTGDELVTVHMLRKDVMVKRDYLPANAHRFVHFGLELVGSITSDTDVLGLLDPFVDLTGDGLYSRYNSVITMCCKAWTVLVRLPLPSLAGGIPVVIKRLFYLFRQSSNTNSDMIQSAFKLLASLLRSKTAEHLMEGYVPEELEELVPEKKDKKGKKTKQPARPKSKVQQKSLLTDDQLRDLIDFIRPDIEEPERQATAFGLDPRNPDPSHDLRELMVTAQMAHVRELCRLTWFHAMSFIVQNATGYVFESGRSSALEIMGVIVLLPTAAEPFFLGLVLIIAKDESTKCREMATHLLPQLVARFDQTRLARVWILLDQWSAGTAASAQAIEDSGDDKAMRAARVKQLKMRELGRAALQCYGIIIEPLGDKFRAQKFLAAIDSALTARLNYDGGDLEQIAMSLGAGEDPQDAALAYWETAYMAMNSFAKYIRTSGSLGDSRIWLLVVRHLTHPHSWVRLAAARLIGLYVASADPAWMLMQTFNEQPAEESWDVPAFDGQAKFALMSFERLRELANALVVQLSSKYLTAELGNQIVKNLFFIAKMSSGDESEEEGEEEETTEHASLPTERGLSWLVNRVGRLARTELIRGPVVTIIPPALLCQSSYIMPIVSPLYRTLNDTQLAREPVTLPDGVVKKPEELLDELKALTNEVVQLTQARMGTTEFSKAMQKVKSHVDRSCIAQKKLKKHKAYKRSRSERNQELARKKIRTVVKKARNMDI
ncbi:hypothetical protein DL89DRAFT_265622 [Linderina pennispora]|uniref:ARM repeat-containing protein n=1 Tax=Linderina pennispora TaxID=61395 RepID=A0A1Y1WEG0_9FUNG|nr:uncharacterized protein DL89DRAFT_265622 [Linderina pennispora]ORX71921.1 hypothetical protein DL89DRAFT_265622 [Linderina pennispora]